MKKVMALLYTFILFGLFGCVAEEVHYTPLPSEQIPLQYADGSYSVKGALEKLQTSKSISLDVTGIVYYAFSCPPCPKGAICAACRIYFIDLADPIMDISSAKKMRIFFLYEDLAPVYDELKINQSITMTVNYNANLSDVFDTIEFKEGFVFESLIK